MQSQQDIDRNRVGHDFIALFERALFFINCNFLDDRKQRITKVN